MKCSISNIAWDGASDQEMYGRIRRAGFSGLEIAPTRIFPENPYDRTEEARQFGGMMQKEYGLAIPSMQSIWFGRSENLFGSDKEREILMAYTRKAIDFAGAVGCGNLVFGCPRNRALPEGADPSDAIPFFKELGDYAAERGTVIGMEANPPIYHTNFITGTEQALALVEQVDSKGFLLNLDVGTMIQNGEDVAVLEGRVDKINHVHISEPHLAPIRERPLHGELYSLLKREGYRRYVSIEMGKTDDVGQIEAVLSYVGAVFLDS